MASPGGVVAVDDVLAFADCDAPRRRNHVIDKNETKRTAIAAFDRDVGNGRNALDFVADAQLIQIFGGAASPNATRQGNWLEEALALGMAILDDLRHRRVWCRQSPVNRRGNLSVEACRATIQGRKQTLDNTRRDKVPRPLAAADPLAQIR